MCVSAIPISRGRPLVALRWTAGTTAVVSVRLPSLPSSSSSVVSSSLEQMLNTFTSISVTVKTLRKHITRRRVRRGFPVHVFDLLHVSEEGGASQTNTDSPDWPSAHTQRAAGSRDLAAWRGMAPWGRVTPKMGFLECVCVSGSYVWLIDTHVWGVWQHGALNSTKPNACNKLQGGERIQTSAAERAFKPTRQSNLVSLNVSSSVAHQSCGVRVVFMSSNWRHCSECYVPFSLLTQETECSLQVTGALQHFVKLLVLHVLLSSNITMSAHLSPRRTAGTRWKRPWSWAASKGEASSWTVGCSSRCSRTSAPPLGRKQKRKGGC